MADEKIVNGEEELDEDLVFTLTDEETGEEKDFVVLATAPIDGKQYYALVPADDDGEDIGYSVALRDSLKRFLRSLPERTRTIFVRRYWYVTPISEIAKEFGMKESNVAMLMLRTRLKLKEFLEKEGF